jgi:hypothetical protein
MFAFPFPSFPSGEVKVKSEYWSIVEATMTGVQEVI